MSQLDEKMISPRSIGAALVLSLTFGLIGAQRFYLSRYLTGLAILTATVGAFFTTPYLLALPLLIALHDIWIISGHNFLDGAGRLVQPLLLERDCSQKSFRLMLCLSLFLGFTGIHRFYAGKKTSGLVIAGISFVSILLGIAGNPKCLIGLAIVFIWVLIDNLLILTLNFQDSSGIYIAFNHHGSEVIKQSDQNLRGQHTMPTLMKKVESPSKEEDQ